MRGRILLLTGVSGGGKTTLMRELRRRHPDIFSPISLTNRSPRPGEVEGVHYHFTGTEEFERMILTQKLLVWSRAYGNLYGLLKEPIEKELSEGRDVLFETVVESAKKLHLPNLVTAFLNTPSEMIQRERLTKRGTVAKELNDRLQDSIDELAWARSAEIDIISNENVDDTILAIESLFFSRVVAIPKSANY